MNGSRQAPFIYIATPWGPVGGGMYRVADYLVQAQDNTPSPAGEVAQLRELDTRGNGSAIGSLLITLRAMAAIVRGRLDGRLAGVHVNMAERLSVFRKACLMATCRLLGVPAVLHLHAAQFPQFYRGLGRLARAAVRRVFALPAAVVVLGETARRFVVEELGVPAGRVEIVINGVPEPSVHRRTATGEGLQRLLFLGNLSQRKGVPDLIRALASPAFTRQGVEAVFAGGGDVAAYETLARDCGVADFVRFAGWVDQRQAARLIAAADVLVLPSYDEGLPLVILEAMANGLAVVCTPVGEIPHVMEDGVHAAFVQPGDVPGIARALQAVLSQAELRERFERNGRAVYDEKFSVSRFFDNIAAVHRRCFGVAARLRQPSPEA